ncbi:cation efflux protein, CzcI family [Janthinobacterium sp. LB3P112]|jgi:hypothetical protein|uniref:cation efflux protein, CzcI family n=1 Tax=Janthinobacterium sp. LB3P112 TaxID=3424196 RepID=UPI003F27D580
MRRFFLILLLFVLPLQMSWAAASAYCLHEEGKAAQHLGHHSHQHKADADKKPVADKAEQQKKGQPHSDCNVCHGIGHAWLPAGSSLPVGDTASVNADTSPFFYASHIPDAPKRPDWSSAA